MRGKRWVVLWTLWAMRLVRQPTAPVQVASGLVRGSVSPDGSHARYLGIPYASAERSRRFQAPKPASKWNGVLEAYDEHIRCVQRFTATTILGDEDNCLTLNIYTPLGGDHQNHPLPVMVYIHGGGFRDGSGSPFIYGPEYLVRHGVILVTFNYRLEIIGFLCLGIEEAPGNAGLKDQVEALKWVKENIAAFGGDPDSITLFGESAGSASVFYHLLSPRSSQLFDRAIMQSGSVLSPWSFQFDPLDTASALAKQLGHNTRDPYELYHLFMNMTAAELLSARVPRARGDFVLSENIFVPCVERHSTGDHFLNDYPYELLKRGANLKVPVMVGFNSAEGYMFAGKENDTTISNLNIFDSLGRNLVFPSEIEKKRVADKLNKLYMNDEKITKGNLEKFARYAGDIGITYPVVATVDLMLRASDSPVFAYKFSHDGWMNVVKQLYGFWRSPGATHADELFYLFKLEVTLLQAFFESEMIEKMTTMWTNFAKFGEPTPFATQLLPTKWPPTRKQLPLVFVIDKQFSTEPLWSGEAMLFWNETYSKFRRKT
ncbi:juvenile hormone esterase-like [Battus philenor]|uniref:juvenile hormone esterase-like n=1 Tax=Battus philenor TaxID=42288 RepID=UPI0035CEB0AA